MPMPSLPISLAANIRDVAIVGDLSIDAIAATITKTSQRHTSRTSREESLNDPQDALPLGKVRVTVVVTKVMPWSLEPNSQHSYRICSGRRRMNGYTRLRVSSDVWDDVGSTRHERRRRLLVGCCFHTCQMPLATSPVPGHRHVYTVLSSVRSCTATGKLRRDHVAHAHAHPCH